MKNNQHAEVHKYFLFELRRTLILARIDRLADLVQDIAKNRELWKEAQKYA